LQERSRLRLLIPAIWEGMKSMKPDFEPVLYGASKSWSASGSGSSFSKQARSEYERDGSTSIDTTAQTIEQLRMKFSTLEALLAEAQRTNEAPRRGDSDVSK